MFQHLQSRRPIHPVVRLLLALAFTVGAFAVVSFAGTSTASAHTSTTSGKNAQFEIRFMERLSDHHLAAVKADSICLQKATHDALRDMCASDKASQQMEISEMVSWLSQWYDVHYQPSLTPSSKAMVMYLSTLRKGKSFEVGYMENIMPHHLMAIKMARTCLAQASHQKLLNLCKDVISAQTKEIQEMTGFLCRWYNICNKE